MDDWTAEWTIIASNRLKISELEVIVLCCFFSYLLNLNELLLLLSFLKYRHNLQDRERGIGPTIKLATDMLEKEMEQRAYPQWNP